MKHSSSGMANTAILLRFSGVDGTTVVPLSSSTSIVSTLSCDRGRFFERPMSEMRQDANAGSAEQAGLGSGVSSASNLGWSASGSIVSGSSVSGSKVSGSRVSGSKVSGSGRSSMRLSAVANCDIRFDALVGFLAGSSALKLSTGGAVDCVREAAGQLPREGLERASWRATFVFSSGETNSAFSFFFGTFG